jgi:hypothetical protein
MIPEDRDSSRRRDRQRAVVTLVGTADLVTTVHAITSRMEAVGAPVSPAGC